MTDVSKKKREQSDITLVQSDITLVQPSILAAQVKTTKLKHSISGLTKVDEYREENSKLRNKLAKYERESELKVMLEAIQYDVNAKYGAEFKTKENRLLEEYRVKEVEMEARLVAEMETRLAEKESNMRSKLMEDYDTKQSKLFDDYNAKQNRLMNFYNDKESKLAEKEATMEADVKSKFAEKQSELQSTVEIIVRGLQIKSECDLNARKSELQSTVEIIVQGIKSKLMEKEAILRDELAIKEATIMSEMEARLAEETAIKEAQYKTMRAELLHDYKTLELEFLNKENQRQIQSALEIKSKIDELQLKYAR